MQSLILLAGALEYIEENLTNTIKTQDIADALYCSKSTVEKLFKYVTRMSIRDYMIRRRMSLAAKEIASNKQISLLDLGIKYGYGSNEAFTRAFEGVWHTTPSEFRKNPSRYVLFPGFRLDPELMEEKKMLDRKKVDISELYDFIKERKGCYVIACDIKSLVPINAISIEAGDIAIITSMSRMEQAAGEDDIVFRVGGDEFVMLTASKDEIYAQKIKEKILSHNGEPIVWNGREIPLALYASSFTLDKTNLRYSELFTKIQEELNVVKA